MEDRQVVGKQTIGRECFEHVLGRELIGGRHDVVFSEAQEAVDTVSVIGTKTTNAQVLYAPKQREVSRSILLKCLIFLLERYQILH